MISLGVIAAIGALIGWGVGDFLIQRVTRKIGNMRTLFYNGVFGFIVFLPFAWPEIGSLAIHWQSLILLLCLSCVVFIYALFNFEALRKGKLSVIAPVLALELPMTVLLAVAFVGERPDLMQIFAFIAIFGGFYLVIRQKNTHRSTHIHKIEQGVSYALVGVAGLAIYNIVIASASRVTTPELAGWVIGTTVMLLSGAVLHARGDLNAKLLEPFKKYPALILAECSMTIGAGYCFAFATTLISISAATGISEGYVALSVLLGIFINRERLQKHQTIGVLCVVGGVILLAFLVGS